MYYCYLTVIFLTLIFGVFLPLNIKYPLFFSFNNFNLNQAFFFFFSDKKERVGSFTTKITIKDISPKLKYKNKNYMCVSKRKLFFKNCCVVFFHLIFCD